MKKDVLLFDLGGVIVPWVGHDYLGKKYSMTREEVTAKLAASDIFNAYERGECDDPTFCAEMVDIFGMKMTPDAFAPLWNSWVHPPFSKTLETLENLKQNYTIACLSNTNALHWARLNEMFTPDDVFDYCFASQLMGVAKPAQRSFQIPLEKMGVTADQVLYFDDTKLNVEAARKSGLETYHVDRTQGVLPVLNALNLI